MKAKMYSYKTILVSLGLVLLDLAVYMFLGLLLMTYDDFYDEGKGAYWSWESLTDLDKAVIMGLYFWNAVNLLGLCYILYQFFKKFKHRTKAAVSQH